MRFASINVDPRDGDRLGATSVVGDARLALGALADALGAAGVTTGAAWRETVTTAKAGWLPVRAAALDADTPVDVEALRAQSDDVIPDTDAVLTQGQLIGLLQEHAEEGDTIVAAAGGPPGDLLKVWDATDGRTCHLEFGFSCMGYEIPAAIGIRLANANPRTASSPSSVTARFSWRPPSSSRPSRRAWPSPWWSRRTTATR